MNDPRVSAILRRLGVWRPVREVTSWLTDPKCAVDRRGTERTPGVTRPDLPFRSAVWICDPHRTALPTGGPERQVQLPRTLRSGSGNARRTGVRSGLPRGPRWPVEGTRYRRLEVDDGRSADALQVLMPGSPLDPARQRGMSPRDANDAHRTGAGGYPITTPRYRAGGTMLSPALGDITDGGWQLVGVLDHCCGERVPPGCSEGRGPARDVELPPTEVDARVVVSDLGV